MDHFLIELPHGDERMACIRALRAIHEYGSHFVTQAHWGCKDGVHSGWMIGECESRAHALFMVPPEMRDDARIVKLDRFTPEEIAAWIADLES